MASVTYTRIAELILKHLSGQISHEEGLELDKIIASSKEYKKLYEDMTDPHMLLEEIVRMRNWDIKASWKRCETILFPPNN